MASRNLLEGPLYDISHCQKSFGNFFYDFFRNHENSQEFFLTYRGDAEIEEITIAEFFKLSTNLAQNLINLGVNRGDTIAIVAKNHWKYSLTVIAGFYIGAKVFLLNPEYNPRELEHLLLKSAPKFIFCSSYSLKNVLEVLKLESLLDCGVFCYDHSDDNVANFSEILVFQSEFNGINSKGDDVALILTSSGTTGLPKAVLLTHNNMKTCIAFSKDETYLGMSSNESTIIYLPLFHVFGTILSIISILSGTKLVITDGFKPQQFLQILQDYKITKLFAVPSILVFLTKSPLVANYDLSSIRDVLSGGAFALKSTRDQIVEKFGVKCVRQIYGLTETFASTAMCTQNSENKGDTIGRPFHNVWIKIRDPDSGKSLDYDEIGEICVKGTSIMKGYCDDLEATLSAFDEDNYLRTGDLGYCDKDGYLYVVDRLKDILKCKGFQVSPTEIENVLLEFNGIKEAAVVGKPDERAGEVPIAFIVKQPNWKITEQDIIKHVEDNLSRQKRLYGGVKFIDELPKTSSGKILRRKLQEMV